MHPIVKVLPSLFITEHLDKWSRVMNTANEMQPR